MSYAQKRILEMLVAGKINIEEAHQLLSLVGSGECEVAAGRPEKNKRKYLRILIRPQNGTASEEAEQVNIRVPVALLHAGVKLTALIPSGVVDKANETMAMKGINFDLRNLKPDDLEPLIDALNDLKVDTNDKKEKVHILVE